MISSNRLTRSIGKLRNHVARSEFGRRLGSRDGGFVFVFAFDSSQLITQARSFGAILFGFDTELDGADAAHRVDDLGDATALAVAGMFELVDEIVLVQGVGLH